MVGTLFYGAIATFPDAESARGYAEFAGRVVSRVVSVGVSVGAVSGRVVALNGVEGDPKVRFETQYAFLDRRAFEDYKKSGLAQKLRDEGREIFGHKGVSFELRTGSIENETEPIR